MIAIINHRLGNFGSILNMLKKIGVEGCITSDPQEIRRARKLILPGVGSFNAGMRNLRELGLLPVLNECVLASRVPILGICLGMQLFTQGSEEGQEGEAAEPGLGWIAGWTRRFAPLADPAWRLPHMGWNYIESSRHHPLVQELPQESRFYFVHSYHVCCEQPDHVLLQTHYGGHDFTSAVAHNNILGTQFHPEKSHRFGMQLLRNFAYAL